MRMRSLFFKVFAIFWLAQNLIFVISTTLIVRQRFAGPGTVADALDSNLEFNARQAMRAYNAAGCAGFADNGGRNEPAGAMLLDAKGRVLCSTSAGLALPGLMTQFPNRVDGRQVGGRYVWLAPVTGSDGGRDEYVWFQPASVRKERHPDLWRYAFPSLPVAIGVGGLTTFVLVLLFSRPLVRLRRAARELAKGNLAARVPEPRRPYVESHADEFQGLVHDFNHMAERLESLVGAQRLLLRDVSHELRSPLSRLSVALELAREDAGAALQPHLARIEREGEKLNQLIAELLVLASMDSVESGGAFEPVSLNQLCEQLLPDAEYEAQRRPCAVTLVQEPGCTVAGDAHLLHRAVENVVRNAIRYTEPGSEVTLVVRKGMESAKKVAVIEVMDRGPGIPVAELDKIFQPFYRVDHARSTSTGGFGVGLAITERAIRAHGGHVRATNREGGGICVTMSLLMV